MSQKNHWDQVYSIRLADELGWYAPHLDISLTWIKGLGLDPVAAIIDVGGGASTLVDDLVDAGYRSITVLDISEKALSAAKERLGKKAGLVTWSVGDITSIDMPTHCYELWHDRAVFHFLTVPEKRRSYRDNLVKTLQAGGHLIIGTFAPEAPPTCSGLPVQRYTSEQLQSVLGAEFQLIRRHKELHITPGGVEQMYLYCHFRKTA